MTRAIGIVMLVFAALQLSGIWIPRFRGVWKGSRVPLGAASQAAGAVCFASVGIVFVSDAKLPFNPVWMAIAFAVAWLVAVVGHAFDARRSAAAGMIPIERSRSATRTAVAFFAFGLLLLGFIVTMAIRR